MRTSLAAVLLFVAAGVSPEPRYFRYQRPVQNTPQRPVQTCAVLDADLLAQTTPQLADLRLYHNGQETPYVVHLPPAGAEPEVAIAPLNLGSRQGDTTFDVPMPEASYSDLELQLNANDFIATVTVSGSQQQGAPGTKLGSYTIFDLTRQRLGRSTILHLPESDFRYLHLQIAGPIRPENIGKVSIERLTTREPNYETVAASSAVRQKGHSSVLELTVPAHVPVDRIAFSLGQDSPNFSRGVSIVVAPVMTATPTDAAEPPQPVSSSGSLLRLHKVQNGHRIDEEQLAIAAPAAEFDSATNWTVSIDNGDDAPLPITSIRLEMLQRRLCFESAGVGEYVLRYGDEALAAPRYDYAALFAPQADAVLAVLGPQQQNASYERRPDVRPFSERHPAMLWAVLIVVIALLGGIALRSAKRTALPQ